MDHHAQSPLTGSTNQHHDCHVKKCVNNLVPKERWLAVSICPTRGTSCSEGDRFVVLKTIRTEIDWRGWWLQLVGVGDWGVAAGARIRSNAEREPPVEPIPQNRPFPASRSNIVVTSSASAGQRDPSTHQPSVWPWHLAPSRPSFLLLPRSFFLRQICPRVKW